MDKKVSVLVVVFFIISGLRFMGESGKRMSACDVGVCDMTPIIIFSIVGLILIVLGIVIGIQQLYVALRESGPSLGSYDDNGDDFQGEIDHLE